MHLNENHLASKNISTKLIFSAQTGKILSIFIKANAVLAEHTTPIDALLLCVSGEVKYQDENGRDIHLSTGEYMTIEPKLIHKVEAYQDSQLLLIR